MLQIAIDTTHEEVSRLVYHTVLQFVNRYGGDSEELLSLANTLYMDAYYKYDASRGSFSNWVRYRVHCGLLESLRNQCLHNRRYTKTDLTLVAKEQPSFSVKDFLGELSEDARAIVKLILDDDITLKTCLLEKKDKRTPCNYRSSLREILKDIGWGAKRIAESFQEIARALRG